MHAPSKLRNFARSLDDCGTTPTMAPRLGSFVILDSWSPPLRTITGERWKTEFDRPIYFVELLLGYVCSWCQVDGGKLIVIPHTLSHHNIRRVDYRSEAEIVGRVTGAAMRDCSSANGVQESSRNRHAKAILLFQRDRRCGRYQPPALVVCPRAHVQKLKAACR